MIFGYARVSTDSQTLDAQLEALKAAGVHEIFRETAGGAKSDRTELAALMKAVKTGDSVYVTRLDRLARSTRDLLNLLATLSERGAAFRSLSEAWADTTTAHGRLIVAILGGLAEFERELIRVRTSEGRARAKAQGRHLGRTRPLTPHHSRKLANVGRPVSRLGRSPGASTSATA